MAKQNSEPAGKQPKNKVKPPWREGVDFVVMLGGAVLIALLIKAYVADVYLIPSGSMETALHGRPDGGDRIFCSKLAYRFRPVQRWEVAVFEFPYETARKTDTTNTSELYRGQNFVKRVVGMPGEMLAIARGDIWVRPEGARDYQRVVKPDKVQRGMWLNVYDENFADLSLDEFARFWKIRGDAKLNKGGPLALAAGREAARIEFRPQTRSSPDGDSMVELPGVPDRYTLEQPIQFRCKNTLPDGKVCDQLFVKTIKTQNIQARCSVCGALADEAAAVFYHRRSGLPDFGPYAVDPREVPQGEEGLSRQSNYHFVPDLRTLADVTLADENSAFIITHREDTRFVQAWFFADGRVEVRVNGQASKPTERALSPIRAGQKHKVEFYVIDGTARIFVDATDKAVLDVAVWNDKRPYPKDLVKSSGVELAASGGDVRLSSIAIDRDVFYYSGLEQPASRNEKHTYMESQTMGEVYINASSFLPMGDHCPSSYDARSWGPVPLNLLRGPALAIWWPPERMQRIPTPVE